ncbi:ChaN family lipoprotein [Leptospira sp. 96542]|nr:ChaN family lipoprotein [Leptospira sp. 96542]
MKTIYKLLLFFIFIFAFPAVAEELNYELIETPTGKPASFESIQLRLESTNVIVLGEEHDDRVFHQLSLDLFKSLSQKFPISLSLEMLERDQQTIINEYLSGVIGEKQLFASIVHWKNFKEDYFPLVQFAKENQIPVLCSNPPRRYVNLITQKGLLAYQSFPPAAEPFLPDAYRLEKYLAADYKERLNQLFSGHHGGAGPKTEFMILAQATWDQGMADSISRERYRSGRKVFHINGRFHSDREGGVVYRLRQMGESVLVLSGFSKGKEDPSDFKKIADFVILTNGR